MSFISTLLIHRKFGFPNHILNFGFDSIAMCSLFGVTILKEAQLPIICEFFPKSLPDKLDNIFVKT